jgi:hypothetical protein
MWSTRILTFAYLLSALVWVSNLGRDAWAEDKRSVAQRELIDRLGKVKTTLQTGTVSSDSAWIEYDYLVSFELGERDILRDSLKYLYGPARLSRIVLWQQLAQQSLHPMQMNLLRRAIDANVSLSFTAKPHMDKLEFSYSNNDNYIGQGEKCATLSPSPEMFEHFLHEYAAHGSEHKDNFLLVLSHEKGARKQIAGGLYQLYQEVRAIWVEKPNDSRHIPGILSLRGYYPEVGVVPEDFFEGIEDQPHLILKKIRDLARIRREGDPGGYWSRMSRNEEISLVAEGDPAKTNTALDMHNKLDCVYGFAKKRGLEPTGFMPSRWLQSSSNAILWNSYVENRASQPSACALGSAAAKVDDRQVASNPISYSRAGGSALWNSPLGPGTLGYVVGQALSSAGVPERYSYGMAMGVEVAGELLQESPMGARDIFDYSRTQLGNLMGTATGALTATRLWGQQVAQGAGAVGKLGYYSAINSVRGLSGPINQVVSSGSRALLRPVMIPGGTAVKGVIGGAVLAAPAMVYGRFQREYSAIRAEHAQSTEECLELAHPLYWQHRQRCESEYGSDRQRVSECLNQARAMYKRELAACMAEFSSGMSSLLF